jgi:ABC-2 type transport system permease protein
VSFPGAVAFGFVHPVTIVAAAAFVVVAATIPAAERESGLLDLVLARPVPRGRYLLSVALMLVVGAVLLPLALFAGAAFGLGIVTVEERLPLVRYAPAAAGLGFLLLAVGGYSLLFAAGAKRRGPAIGRAVGLTLAFYVVEFLADFWEPLDRIRWLSPFHYYKPIAAAVVPHTPPENPLVLLAAFVVLVAAAHFRFRRQDL